MKIIYKFIFKNLLEKKMRTFIVLLTITISASLFFASISISDTMVNVTLKRMQQFSGSSDIIIRPTENSPSRFFATNNESSNMEKLDYLIGAVEDKGYFYYDQTNIANVNILGIKLDDLQVMNPFKLHLEKDLYSFEGNKIIISKKLSQKYNIVLGDIIELKINNNDYRFRISAISEPLGIFREEGLQNFVVVPKDFLSSIYGVKGQSNIVFAKAKDNTDLDDLMFSLSEDYKNYSVREAISKELVEHQVSGIASTFLLMTIIVALLSIFIIYSSFKVITIERLPIMGTFRSVGASRKITNLVLLSESFMYGILGGILGCILGVGILIIMSLIISGSIAQGEFLVEIQATKLLMAFLMALILTLISSLIPITRVTKISVKDIVLNKLEESKVETKQSDWRLIFGVVFLIFSIAVPPILTRALALPLGIIAATMSIVGIILLVPYIVKGAVKIFEKIIYRFFSNEGILAVKNLHQDKNLLTNISLLSISISTILMINIVGYGVVMEMYQFYNTAPKYDIMVTTDQMSRDVENMIQSIDGVSDVHGVYFAQSIEVKDKDTYIGLIESADRREFLEYWNFEIRGDQKQLIEQLDEGRNIIISDMIKNKLGVKVGDVITLKMIKGNKDYKVISTINTPRNSGDFALISSRYLRADMDSSYYSMIYVKTFKDPFEVEKTLRKRLSMLQPWTMTMKEAANIDFNNSKQQFSILKGFSVLSLIIALLSIVNNLIISFIQRKKSIAMFRSVGMSRKQVVKVILTESLLGSIIGGITGVVGGIILISVVPYILKAINQRIVVHYSPSILVVSFLVGITVMIIASISPALKSSRLNIIEAIKNE